MVAPPIEVGVRVLPHGEGLPLPAYESAGAAGMDVRAAITDPIELAPGERGLVPTGICLALPSAVEAQVRPRSGWALRHGVTCLNAPGTIDSDYRGEVCVLLINHGQKTFVIERGQRIAQLVIAPVTQALLRVRTSLDATVRGAGGFGHTGGQ